MRLIYNALLATGLAAVATPSFAQTVLEANVARADDRWGGEIGAGYTVINIGGFGLTPAVGAFIFEGDNDRYSLDDNGGNPRCRDTSNGQYADSELCNNLDAKFYGRVELTYMLPASVTLGGGVRYMSDDFVPYGTVAVPIGGSLQIKGNAGPDYFAGGLNLRF